MDSPRRARKPYTVYRSGDGAAAEAAPPPRGPQPPASGGGRPPRRGRRRRRGGLILVVVVLVVLAALAAAVVATLRPFGDGTSATASTAAAQPTAATGEPAQTAAPTPTPTRPAAVAKSGINVVTMANNHAGDMGDSGLLDSFKYCKKAGITVVGAGKSLKTAQAGAVLNTDGARTAFLGFSDVLPVGYPATSTSPGTSPGRANINAVKANIRAAAKKADYVFVAWHWNFEYKRAPSYLESSEGKAAIDAGADIVFAHHPHLLDGVQVYHGGLICYSLGNLVFSGFAGETAQTMLVKAKVTPHAIDAKLIPVQISGSGVPTVATGSTGSTGLSILQRVKSLSAALGTSVKIADNRGYVHVNR